MRPQRSGRSWSAKKVLAQLDAEQREALLYLTHPGLAICSAALVTELLRTLSALGSSVEVIGAEPFASAHPAMRPA
jgi:hypothetical protein